MPSILPFKRILCAWRQKRVVLYQRISQCADVNCVKPSTLDKDAAEKKKGIRRRGEPSLNGSADFKSLESREQIFGVKEEPRFLP